MGHFFSFTPLTAQKSKLKKIKTPGDIMSLHKCIKNQDHILCCSWDMARDRCNCYFFSFWAICCPFNSPPPRLSLTTRKIKMKKSTWRYYHFTHVYHKWQSHDVWFLKYGAWQTEFFVILDLFWPFYTPNNPKNQN